MNDGYIKMYRKLLGSQVFANEGLLKTWVWCLLKANHKKKWVSVRTGKGETNVEVLPGQFIFGRHTAAADLGVSPSTLRNRIARLIALHKISQKTDTHYSVISILNWDTYQDNNRSKRTTKGQPKDTNKNEKNKTYIGEPLPDFLESDLWNEFLNHRIEIKSPMTQRAQKLAIGRLIKFNKAGHDVRSIIEKSIEMGWKGLFEPKAKKSKPLPDWL